MTNPREEHVWPLPWGNSQSGWEDCDPGEKNSSIGCGPDLELAVHQEEAVLGGWGPRGDFLEEMVFAPTCEPLADTEARTQS